MDKRAQRRSMFQWLHEKANVPRKLTEWYSGEYKDQMELLRVADDNARQQAKTLEYWLRSEKRSLNKHHYIDVAYFANQIAQVIGDIIHGYDELRNLRKTHEHDIVLQREHAPDEFLNANAGIISRYFEGRAKRLLLGEQKREMTKLYQKSKELIVATLRGLKEMGSLRARGEIAGYLKEVDALDKHLNGFNQIYSEVYNKHVKGLIPAKVMPETQTPETPETPETTSEPPAEPFPLTTQKKDEPELKVEVDAGPGIAPAIPSPPEPPAVFETPEPSKPDAPTEGQQSEQTESVQTEPAQTAPKVEDSEKPKAKRKPKTKKPPKAADKIIIEMIRSGMEIGMSDGEIRSMLIEKSAEFDDEHEFSIKLLAMAEGFIDA